MLFARRAYSRLWIAASFVGLILTGCASVSVPDSRTVEIPAPTAADQRKKAINERPDTIMYLPLGEDMLIPSTASYGSLPNEKIGPFELRSETLAGALQLILAEYEIPMAFETEEGLTRQVTVANLRGPLNKVISRVCSMADLYCSYEDGMLVIKDTQTFTVTLPPIGDDTDDTEFLDNVSEGLAGILGEGANVVIDETTRTLIYTATHRTAEIAARYFQRLRANTALIVFESYIWEVSLTSGNSMGVDWNRIYNFGKFNANIGIDGSIGADFTNPISIGLPTVLGAADTEADINNIVEFLSQFGAVKTISQPQVSVLSGSSAELRVADTQNFVSEITTTLDDGQSSTSVNTDSVDTGFTFTIDSTWDKSTIYANIDIELTNVLNIQNFTFSDGGATGTDTTIQLPQTSERQITTQVRVRPGDAILLAGLVREQDNYDTEGPGFMEPVIPQSRTATTANLELVMLLRPRVVAYTSADDPRYISYVQEKKRDLAKRFAPERKPSKPQPLDDAQASHVSSSRIEEITEEQYTEEEFLEEAVLPGDDGYDGDKPYDENPILIDPEITSEEPFDSFDEDTINVSEDAALDYGLDNSSEVPFNDDVYDGSTPILEDPVLESSTLDAPLETESYIPEESYMEFDGGESDNDNAFGGEFNRTQEILEAPHIENLPHIESDGALHQETTGIPERSEESSGLVEDLLREVPMSEKIRRSNAGDVDLLEENDYMGESSREYSPSDDNSSNTNSGIFGDEVFDPMPLLEQPPTYESDFVSPRDVDDSVSGFGQDDQSGSLEETASPYEELEYYLPE